MALLQKRLAKRDLKKELPFVLSAMVHPKQSGPLRILRQQALQSLLALSSTPLSFADQWYLLKAARGLNETSIAAWVRSKTQRKNPWMLRALALDTLLSMRTKNAQATLVNALRDPYPRVRLLAITRVAQPNVSLMASLYTQEPWPRVRTALLSRWSQANTSAEAWIRAGIGDASVHVNIHTLTLLKPQHEALAIALLRQLIEPPSDTPAPDRRLSAMALKTSARLCLHTLSPHIRRSLQQTLNSKDTRDNPSAGHYQWVKHHVQALQGLHHPEASAAIKEMQEQRIRWIRQLAQTKTSSKPCLAR